MGYLHFYPNYVLDFYSMKLITLSLDVRFSEAIVSKGSLKFSNVTSRCNGIIHFAVDVLEDNR